MAKKRQKKIRLPAKETLILTAIVLLALTLRLVSFAQLKTSYPPLSMPVEGTDMLTTHRDALAHLDGTFERFPHYFNPLLPYFVTLIYMIFGKNILIAKIVHILIGTINCILIYFLAKKLFNKHVGLIAAFLTAIYTMFIIYNFILLIVTPLSFLLMSTLLLLLKTQAKPCPSLAIAAGISMGLTALARASHVFFIPVVILWFLVMLKEKAKKAAVVCLIFLISSLSIISIITIQNYVLGDRLVPVSTNGGINFAIGNCPGAQGWFHYPDWLKATPERRQADGGDSMFWFKETFRTIGDNPVRWLKLLAKKFGLFWHYQEKSNNIDPEAFIAHSPLLKHFPLLSFGIVAPLALVGIAISARQWRKLFLLYIFLFLYMCSIVLLMVLTRYRVPFVQMLIPFAAFTIYQIFVKLKQKDFKFMGAVVLSLIPAIILVRAFDIYQFVDKRLYMKAHPYGTYLREENRVKIRDDSGLWHGGIYAALNAYSKIRKELVIDTNLNLSQIKKSWLSISFVCPQRQGEIILRVNNRTAGRIECAQIYSGGKIGNLETPFNPALLVQGKNTFTLSVTEGAAFIVLIDDHYHYQRSAFSSILAETWDYLDLAPNSKGKNLGEYMISLNLEFQENFLQQ